MTTGSGLDALTALLGDAFSDDLAAMLARMGDQFDWADDEIANAQQRHPAKANLLFHAFTVLTPTHKLMGTEFVYRGHCRELLDRVAAGQDTRPGTAAEVCLVCCESSQLAPLTDTAAGLYGRMWNAAGFPGEQWDNRQDHHEALSGPQIDDAERELRRKLTVATRRAKDIECSGRHHGEPVSCEYAKPVPEPAGPVQLSLDAA